MSLGKICPTCGKSESKVDFVGNFCVECVTKREPLFTYPERLEGKICPTCGRLRLREWVADSLQNVGKWVHSKIKSARNIEDVHIRQEELKDGRDIHTRVTVDVLGTPLTQEATLHLKLIKEQCIDCSRKASGYFEAIVQLRGPDEKQEKTAQKIAAFIERRGAWVVKVEERKEGMDVYTSSKMLTSEALASLKVDTTVSKKQAGMREGQTIYRTTYLVRLDEQERKTGKMISSS